MGDPLVDLTDRQLQWFVQAMAEIGMQLREDGDMLQADNYHALAVAGAEHQDWRAAAEEAARVALDGDDAGELWDGSPPSFD